MRVAVFGSTGHVGLLLISRLLTAQHDVVAYARSPEKLTRYADRITIVNGDLENETKIREAVRGADAVISVMGPNGYQDALIFAPAYERIISAMKTEGATRLIALGTPTIRDPQDRFNLMFEALILIVSFIINKGSEDIANVGKLVRESDLDYTLVRVPLLTNGKAKRAIKTGAFGAPVWWPFLTRSNFVDFVMRQLTDTTYIRKVVAISN